MSPLDWSEILTMGCFMIFLGVVLKWLWRDSRREPKVGQRWHWWVMMGTVGVLEVACGWYWVGLFVQKM